MVTYDEIFEVFCRYAASRSQSDWCDLWMLCTRRMEALVKTKARVLKVPPSPDDIADIVTDSTILVLKRLREASDVSPAFISKTFWYKNMAAFKTYNRAKRKIEIEERIAQALNENIS